MMDRRLFMFGLIPLWVVGGAAIRVTEKVMASPAIPARVRWGGGGINYFWTDGTETYYSGYDVPKNRAA